MDFLERARTAINATLGAPERLSVEAFADAIGSPDHIVVLRDDLVLVAYPHSAAPEVTYLFIWLAYSEAHPSVMRSVRALLAGYARERGFAGLMAASTHPAFARYLRPTRTTTLYFEDFNHGK